MATQQTEREIELKSALCSVLGYLQTAHRRIHEQIDPHCQVCIDIRNARKVLGAGDGR